MSKIKPLTYDKEFKAIKYTLSGLLLAYNLGILLYCGALIRAFCIALLLIACTGFIWFSDQIPGFTDRAGNEVSPEGAGCLIGGGAWLLLILAAVEFTRATSLG